MLTLGPDMERICFQSMKGFLTAEFSEYPAAKNLIPVLAFNARHNQRDAPLQKNVKNCLTSNGMSINKYQMV